MKKIFTILSVFLGLGFVVCFVAGMFGNVPEIVSPPTGAGLESKSKIIDSFAEVKEYLNVNNNRMIQ